MAMKMVYQKAVCLYLLVYIHVNSLILILFVLRHIKRDPFITHLLVYDYSKPYRDCWIGLEFTGCGSQRNILLRIHTFQYLLISISAVLDFLAKSSKRTCHKNFFTFELKNETESSMIVISLKCMINLTQQKWERKNGRLKANKNSIEKSRLVDI